MVVATAQVGMARERPTDRRSAPSAGQTATHSQAAGALGRLHRGERVDREQRRAGLRALRAVDARVGVAADARRADERDAARPARRTGRGTGTRGSSRTPSRRAARAITAAPVVPMWRKKFSIFTSATRPYGLVMNAVQVGRGHRRPPRSRRSPSSRYFRLRSGMSSQRGAWKLRPKISRPPSQSHSDSVPTGHSQLQNAFRATNEIADERDQQEHAPPGGSPGSSPVSSGVLQVHQAGDRQPALDARRAGRPRPSGRRFRSSGRRSRSARRSRGSAGRRRPGTCGGRTACGRARAG